MDLVVMKEVKIYSESVGETPPSYYVVYLSMYTCMLGVSVSKYFVTKRLPGFTYECMEVFGGNGFVEDFPMAR